MKLFLIMTMTLSIASSAFATDPLNFNKCTYWINDTNVEGVLDLSKVGYNTLIEKERSIRFHLMSMGSNPVEVAAYIMGPCTPQEEAIAAKAKWGCAGHELAHAVVELNGSLASLNVSGENYTVKCTP